MRSAGILSGVFGVLVSFSIGCGGSASQGGDRQNCYPNGTCNAGLSCFSNLCVKVDGGSSGGSGGGSNGSGGVSGGGAAGRSSGAAGSAGTPDSGQGGGAAVAGTSGVGGIAGATGLAGTSGSAGIVGAGGGGGAGAAGTSGVGGIAGSTGHAGAGGTTGSGGAGGAGAGCSSGGPPITPSILILVDRSGSEFVDATNGTFFNLRTAVEQVVMQLQGQVRFGLASFVGDHSSGVCLLNYQSVPIALNNYSAIQVAYDGWGPLMPFGAKANGPAVEAIPMVRQALQDDPGIGPKYMMIVTDGQTDFCNDGNALCPADAVTYMIQDMYAATPSVGTLVIGLPTSVSNISSAALQDFANAGAGQPVAIPSGAGATTSTDVYNQCTGQGTSAGSYSWSSLYTAAGRAGMTSLATYSATAGTATVYTAATASETDLENQILMAVCSR